MAKIKEVKDFWESHINNEYYTSQARTSDCYFDDITRKRYRYHYHLPELFARIGPGQGKRLLEIGCGIGIDTVALAQQGFKVTAVDLTISALWLAHQRQKEMGFPIRYAMGNCELLPYPDNVFSVVYSFGVLHHTPDMPRAIDEVYRVLKPGGKAYIMLYARYSLVNLIHVIGRIPYESPKNLKDHCPVVYRTSKKEARALFGKFKAVTIHSDYPFTYGMRIISRFIPVFIQKIIGRGLGWHLMIEAMK